MTTENKPRDLSDPCIIFSDPREGDRFACVNGERLIKKQNDSFWAFDDDGNYYFPIAWYSQESATLEITNIRPVPNPEPAAYQDESIEKCGRCGRPMIEFEAGHWRCDYCIMPAPSREDSSAVAGDVTKPPSVLSARPLGVEAERPPAVRVWQSGRTYWVHGRTPGGELWDENEHLDVPVVASIEQLEEDKELSPAEAEKWCEEHPTTGKDSSSFSERVVAKFKEPVMKASEYAGEGSSIPSPDSPGKSDPNAEMLQAKKRFDELFAAFLTQEKPCQPASLSLPSPSCPASLENVSCASGSGSGTSPNAPTDDAWAMEKAERIWKNITGHGRSVKLAIVAVLIEAQNKGDDALQFAARMRAADIEQIAKSDSLYRKAARERDTALARVKELEAEHPDDCVCWRCVTINELNRQLEENAKEKSRAVTEALRSRDKMQQDLESQRDQLAAQNAAMRKGISAAVDHFEDLTEQELVDLIPKISPLVTDFLNCREGIEFLRSLNARWEFSAPPLQLGTFGECRLWGKQYLAPANDPLAAILAAKVNP